MPTTELLRCSRCGEHKPREEMSQNGSKKRRVGWCLICHRTYFRERKAAIKAGTWTPSRRPHEPAQTPTPLDIAWTAGYLEGEGSFGSVKTSLRVRAESTDREPIVKLLALFGGGFSDGVVKTSTGKPVYKWAVSGAKAERVMLAIWPLLCSRRQNRIAQAFIEGK